MVKKTMQDIVVKKNKPVKPVSKPIYKKPDGENKFRKNKLKIIFVATGALVIVFLFGVIMNRFNGVILRVESREEFVDIDFKIKANSETMNMDYSESRELQASGKEYVEKKASGKIVVYNKYSRSPQVLVSETRFESSDGKIYRIKEKITVPGAPGSIEAVVYADKPGESYNIGLSDFTVPGFKGTDKYEKFYARSKTEITGGFVGEMPVISKSDMDSARDDLRKSVEKYLRNTMFAQKLEGFIFYKDAFNISFSPVNHPGEAIIEEKGVAIGYVLNRDEINDILVKKYFADADSSGVEVYNLEELDFDLISVEKGGKEIVFNLKGRGHFVWKMNGDVLIRELVLNKKRNYEDIFKSYPNIKTAEVIFRPSWWHHIPKSQSRIRFEHIIGLDII